MPLSNEHSNMSVYAVHLKTGKSDADATSTPTLFYWSKKNACFLYVATKSNGDKRAPCSTH